MNGYLWQPHLKMVPDNGAEEIIDLTTEFPDTIGPNRIRLRWRNENRRREDINRKVHLLKIGFRFDVQLEIEIFNMEHHSRLATIVNRLQSDWWTVYLSLDGANYREAVLVDVPSPEPIGGKTHAGASYTLGLLGAEVLDELPGQASGGW